MLRIASVVLIVIAFGDMPYGYYNLLRLVICGSSAYIGYNYYKSKKERYAWIFYIQAFVYNPIIPHHFGRELWLLVNVASIAVFVGTYLADKKDARA